MSSNDAGRRVNSVTTVRGALTFASLAVLSLFLVGTSTASISSVWTRQDEGSSLRRSASEAAKHLSSNIPQQRRQAAEELARLAAVEQMRLVEGYRLQEKDSRVRLALDWALYRMGKTPALFELVRALDSSRADQAQQYLKEIDSPAPLHLFLTCANGRTQIRLLEILARIGDADTLEKIRPFKASLDPDIAGAAEFAEREITIRLEESPIPEPKRQRQTGKNSDEDTP